jgi:pantetheine-phosphate adenylyltransferase
MNAIKRQQLIENALQIMNSLDFSKDQEISIFEAWKEPHRFYHNLDHLLNLIEEIENMKNIDSFVKENLYTIAFYHDFVYNPKMVGTNSNDRYGFTNTGWNEAESAYRFMKDIEGNPHFNTDRQILIFDAICATGRREIPAEPTACLFWSIDNKILESPFTDLLRYEVQIEEEFQFVSWPIFRNARVDFLRKEAIRLNSEDLNRLADFVWARRPSVAIYPGSFNPFHKGHFDILQKAERMFDKVIIVKGISLEKGSNDCLLPESIQNREIIYWNGMTTDLIEEILEHSEVTLIRGLRNGKDLDYEVNQYRFMKEMLTDLQVCYIPCDIRFEHISSSAIRSIETFKKGSAEKYLIK